MQEIVAVAKRENNSRRNYLVLNRLQAKHVPASPKRALDYFEELAGQVKEKFGGKGCCWLALRKPLRGSVRLWR